MSGGSRRLSTWSWAFPTGAHHQLIVAAIGRDDTESLAAAQAWLATQDIDTAQFRDHRLLLAVVGRFGQLLREHAAYPRLIGLQRLLWTKSRLATQEAAPSLRSLREAGIELLLIKGASRLALDQLANKHRVAWDIDVVVKPECMARAFDILVAENWNPAPGMSPQYLRERMSSTRGINLFRGDYGDLDLHGRPFHPGQGGADDDALLWASAQSATFFGASVRVPQAEDRVAIALAHGCLDGHTHSDWLVDCAQILRNETCHWGRLEHILMSRRLAASAAITFQYLRQRLGYDIPAALVQELSRAAARRPLRLATELIQARPKERSGKPGQALRWLAKKHRKALGDRYMPRRMKDRNLNVRRVPGSEGLQNGAFTESYRLNTCTALQRPGSLNVEILLDIPSIETRRRVEMEINGATLHYCRIRFRNWRKRRKPQRLRVSGSLPELAPGETLELAARPGKQLRRSASASDQQRYASIPFRVVSCRIM